MTFRKYLLLGIIAILLIVGCEKKEEIQNSETKNEQLLADNTVSDDSQENSENPQEAEAPVEDTENISEGESQETQNNSKTLEHIDKILGKEIVLDDTVLVFSKENEQYKVTYKGESEKGKSLDTKDLNFDIQNDSLSDGTYTFRINKDKLTLYSGNQPLYPID